MLAPGRGWPVQPVLYVWSEQGREQAVLVRLGRIADSGAAAEVARRSGLPPTRLRGVLRPAALDGHIHLTEYGLALGEADLSGCDAAEAAARLTAQARQGGWVLARGARVDLMRELALDPGLLRSLSPLRVWAHDFHTALTDPGTLQQLGLRDADDPPGGRIDREGGTPSGILYETATEALSRATAPDDAARREGALRAVERLFRLGIVGAVDFEVSAAIAAVAGAVRERPFAARIFQIRASGEEVGRPRWLGPRAELLGVKEFLDGTLGSRTAWMHRPYADAPGIGQPRFRPGELAGRLQEYAQRGLAVALHAIGDRAAAEAVELLEPLPTAAAPHRIEHLQVISDGLEHRIAGAGIAASVQPCHLHQDAMEARSAWADRLGETYPYMRLLHSGAAVAFGSDAPVERPDPGYGIAAAMHMGELLGDSRQGISEAVAYRCYTEGVYESLGRTGGRIARGLSADLALYPEPPSAGVLPLLVLSEGRVVYAEKSAYRA